MSDTRRYTQPGWNPEHPLWPRGLQVESPKHQQRDRKSSVLLHKFTKGLKNSLFNLRRKIDDLKLKESYYD